MAPLTRSASTRATKAGGPLQARAKSEPQVLWFGVEIADQDLRIRLVRNKVDDDHTLALLMVHSSRLKKYSTYFSALLSPRWGSKRKRKPDEIKLHVIGNVELYTDCFSRMYNPLEVGFKSVRYSLELLPVASHLGHDDLMSTICLYLASICPWTCYEEMRIRKAVSSENFPGGHAKDLLERLERCLTRDDLRSLVARCMKSLQSDRSKEAYDLLHNLVETASLQERGSIPTFEQDVVTIIIEEFKLLLVQVSDVVEKWEVAGDAGWRADSTEGDRFMLDGKMMAILLLLDIMLLTRTVLGVKLFVRYRLLAKLLVFEVSINDPEAACSNDCFAWTVMMIFKDVLAGNLHLGDSGQDALFLNWFPSLDWIYKNPVDADEPVIFRRDYPALRKCLLSSPPCSQEVIERIIFGKPEFD